MAWKGRVFGDVSGLHLDERFVFVRGKGRLVELSWRGVHVM